MAQHDMNIANQGFPATRADLNNALQALVSNSSGATAPSTTFANQWWYDTTNNKLYFRNEANNAWIEFAVLDQTNNEWQVVTGSIKAKDSDGLEIKTDDGTVRFSINDSTGDVAVTNNLSVGQQNRIYLLNSGGFSPNITNNANAAEMEFHTSNSQAMVIDSSQNVGIGKTSPTRDGTTTSLAIGDSSQAASLDLYGSVNNWAFFTGGGGDLQMYDLSGGAKRWSVDNNGHVTAPYQSAFSAKRNTTLNNFTVGSVVDLSFVTEFFDQNADFNGTTYTAPVTGRYMLSAHLRLDSVDTAAGYYQMRIITSNRTHIYTIDPNFSSDPSYLSLTMSILADMDASDTAKIGVIQSGGSTQTDVNDESFFSGFLAC